MTMSKKEQVWQTSHNTVVRPVGRTTFLASTSISSSLETAIDVNALQLLGFFTTPATVAEAFAEFGSTLAIARDEFEAAVGELRANNLLIPVDSGSDLASIAAVPGRFGQASRQLKMLRDQRRMDSYRQAIEHHVRGKRVLDLGCGSGIMSLFASRAGASSISAIEETDAIHLARQLAEANGYTVTLHHGSSVDVELETSVDVIIHELIGCDPFQENMLLYLADARDRFLAPGGRMLPAVIEIRCVGVDAAAWHDQHAEIAEARQLGVRYQADFSPLAASLERDLGPRPRWAGGPALEPASIVTEAGTLMAIDFHTFQPHTPVEVAPLVLRGARRGLVRSILVYFRAEFDERTVLETSPAQNATHWGWIMHDLPEPREMTPGGSMTIGASIGAYEGVDRLMIRILDPA